MRAAERVHLNAVLRALCVSTHFIFGANTSCGLWHWLPRPICCGHFLSNPERDAPLQSWKTFDICSLSFLPTQHLSRCSVILFDPWGHSSSQALGFFSPLYQSWVWAQPLALKNITLIPLFLKKYTQSITPVRHPPSSHHFSLRNLSWWLPQPPRSSLNVTLFLPVLTSFWPP